MAVLSARASVSLPLLANNWWDSLGGQAALAVMLLWRMWSLCGVDISDAPGKAPAWIQDPKLLHRWTKPSQLTSQKGSELLYFD